MDTDKIIVVAEIHSLLSELNKEELSDVLGFIKHNQSISSLICPREKGRLEIQQAIKSDFDF